ncbi:TPA: superinfection exclusion protein B [Escherichia coli]|nr:superinfection exclusion protein B [Escherichia coli]EJQ7838445.1 superinfection exclusion B family protein [Escherichia coli]MBI1119765.1 superinfection exclusion protein B [Escherichia coli]MCV8620048.1 superinfection exclusion B family protein [Escherichia coli]HBA5733915.1 superinfection exclusion protein B [Escherichia coli]
MNNSWWQELMHFFLQGMTLKQLIHMLIILIILVIVMPVSVKEWINLHNPEILPHYWMYYILLFCVSYVLNGVVNSAYHAVTERIEIFAAQKRKSKEEKYVQDLFDSLTLGERAYLAFAVAANNQLKTEKGSPEAISLLEKGLLIRVPSATGYPEIDRFVIPERYRNECYIRFAGKKDSLMDELIAQDKHGKNK